jgi:NOL1/NOP2/fmu family ribosome biogenesis protein
MNFQILDKTKKKKFMEKIEKFGVGKVPYLFLRTGKEKVRGYSGDFSNHELVRLMKWLNVHSIGLYLGKEFDDNARLSLDGVHMLNIAGEIKESFFEMNKEQEELWFRGKDVDLTDKQKEACKDLSDFVVVRSEGGDDLLGIGRLSGDKNFLFNFVPKERRVKN